MPLKPEEQYTLVVSGNSPKKTYAVSFVSTPTAQMDVVSIKAGAGKVLRLRQLSITSRGQQTTAGLVQLQLGSISAFGTGGSAEPVRAYGTADGDPAAVSTARVGDTTPGANFVPFVQLRIWVPNASAAAPQEDFQFSHSEHKAPTVADSHATVKAFALRHPGAAGAANFAGFIEFTEEDEA
jgi:hypothetical protein